MISTSGLFLTTVARDLTAFGPSWLRLKLSRVGLDWVTCRDRASVLKLESSMAALRNVTDLTLLEWDR